MTRLDESTLASATVAQHLSDHNQIHSKANYVFDVTDYGALGDDSTDDTAAIQAAIDAAELVGAGRVVFPPGTYKLLSQLTVSQLGVDLVGYGRRTSLLKQYTAGQPVVHFDTVLTHSNLITDLAFTYDVAQTDTGSVAISFRVSGGSSSGMFHQVFDRIMVQNAYQGLALTGTGAEKQVLWNTTIRNSEFFDCKENAIYLASPTASGKPNLRIDSIFIENANVTATGEAIYLSAQDIQLINIDIEKWVDRAILVIGGTSATIQGLHIEKHTMDTAFADLIYSANAPLTLNDVQVTALTSAATNTGTTSIVNLGSANATLILGNVSIGTVTDTGGPSYRVVKANTNSDAVTVHGKMVDSSGLFSMPVQSGELEAQNVLNLSGPGIGLGKSEILFGSGTPESAVTANIGSLFLRSDGGASTSLYVKESGTGNTGWVAK